MKSRILGALLSLLFATHAIASIDVTISLRELYESSSVVAVVDVLEGRVVVADGESCGARYKGRVLDGTKNATVDQIIEFGFAPSLKVGSKYFVLLDDYKNVPVERIPEFQARCQGALPKLALVGIWRGAMEVTSRVDDPMQKDAWTVSRTSFVEYPVGTRGTLVRGERQLVFTDMLARMKNQRAASR